MLTGIATVHAQTLGSIASTSAVLAVCALCAVALYRRGRAALDDRMYSTRRDPLTGVLNTSAFDDAIRERLAAARQNGTPLATARLQLDGWPGLRASLDPLVADRLLYEVARRLEGRCGERLVGRSAGDEFTVLIEGPVDLDAVAESLHRSLNGEVVIGDERVRIAASMGVSHYPRDGETWDDLRRRAGFALHSAKSARMGLMRSYEQRMERRERENCVLESALHGAVDRGELALHYQPIACVATGGIIGFEALLRWTHPRLGAISPARFVRVAETSGQMAGIGDWALREACRAAALWSQPLKVSVNVSAVQFDDGLVDRVRAALTESGLPAARLELEVTEGVLIEDAQSALAIMRELRGMGVSIALDDFGTGFSSLSYFRQYPFDKVKIDQSFVQDLFHNRQSLAIIKAVVSLSHTLGLLVLAEGVETVAQMEVLSAEGCDQVQGYAIGRPAAEPEPLAVGVDPAGGSHRCGGDCDGCLERLRAPCRSTVDENGQSVLFITRSAA